LAERAFDDALALHEPPQVSRQDPPLVWREGGDPRRSRGRGARSTEESHGHVVLYDYNPISWGLRVPRALILTLVLLVPGLAACGIERPIHPLRLEGFPGAPIEADLFPLRPGTKWNFVDRLTGKELALRLVQTPKGLDLEGARRGGARVRIVGGFLEIDYAGDLVDRPLKLKGRVGDRWRAGGALYTVFGYDRIMAAGKLRRALVVAADRPPLRDLYWFAPGIGFARLRTERSGRVVRDARLKSFQPGTVN